jgi:hypothetical protein
MRRSLSNKSEGENLNLKPNETRSEVIHDNRNEGLGRGNLIKSGGNHQSFGSGIKERNENLKTEPWRPINEEKKQVGMDDKK